jgi:transcriptional regulator with XRE-family HTH domain
MNEQPLTPDELAELSMSWLNQWFTDSGLTLEAMGQKMGYESGVARRAVWQFLTKTKDPRLSTLIAFMRALDMPLEDLMAMIDDAQKAKGAL